MTRHVSVLAGLTLGSMTTLADSNTAPDDTLRFRVLLDGDSVGKHHFELRTSGDTWQVVGKADFRVRPLFVDAYRYRHTATERGRGGCLESLTAHTDSNGEVVVVAARRSSEGLVVNAAHTQARHSGYVRSFAYWNPKILDGGRLLNTRTGEYLPVRVAPLGDERSPVRRRLEDIRRYRRTAEGLEIDLWYADGKEWVALESRVADGRRLRYERQ